MIDIHCHILPGMDDGPPDMKAALKMARIAIRDGIDTIIATPHCFDGVHDCQDKDIKQAVHEFNAAIMEAGLKLTVLPGAEVRFVPELQDYIEDDSIVNLCGPCNHILLELPENFIPGSVLEVSRRLKEKNIRSILAHPERNNQILFNNALSELKYAVELQLTADSINGKFGRGPKLFARDLIKNFGRCHIATDGHNSRNRKPKMKKAMRTAAKLLGRQSEGHLSGVELFPIPRTVNL